MGLFKKKTKENRLRPLVAAPLEQADADEPDGCELDFKVDPTHDEDLDYVALFADLQEEINKRTEEYKELFK